MPIVNSTYAPSYYLRNAHIQTMYPTLFRKVPQQAFKTYRIDTQDSDFLEYDHYENNSNNLVILSHGLEGNAKRIYMRGMASKLLTEGFDVYAWNFRSCGADMNLTARLYHSGAIDDLNSIINTALEKNKYKSIHLVGFSMGGNLTLNYLGSELYTIPTHVKSAVCISVPCDLLGSTKTLEKMQNKIYMQRFLKSLKNKLLAKNKQFPKLFDLTNYNKIRSFIEFDDLYTAPLHGFSSALDYYKKTSSLFVLGNIQIPTLMLSASDDPFLSESCFPFEEATRNKKLYFEQTKHGGHVGFIESGKYYFSENRTAQFLTNQI